MLVLKWMILVCFLAGPSYCMSVECYTMSRNECGPYSVTDEKLPVTVGELHAICDKVIPYGHCLLGMSEKCAKMEDLPFDNEKEVEEMRDVVEFIESSCDADSQIFKAIADNLHCVMSNLKTLDDICKRNDLNDTIRQKLNSMIHDEEYPCGLDAWIYYCTNARFNYECGNEVRGAVSEILFKFDYVSEKHCKEEIQRFSYLEDAFESEFRLGKRGQAVVNQVFEIIAEKEDKKEN